MESTLAFLHGNLWGIGIGLIVGWWFLPQPGFIRRFGMMIGVVKE